MSCVTSALEGCARQRCRQELLQISWFSLEFSWMMRNQWRSIRQPSIFVGKVSNRFASSSGFEQTTTLMATPPCRGAWGWWIAGKAVPLGNKWHSLGKWSSLFGRKFREFGMERVEIWYFPIIVEQFHLHEAYFTYLQLCFRLIVVGEGRGGCFVFNGKYHVEYSCCILFVN